MPAAPPKRVCVQQEPAGNAAVYWCALGPLAAHCPKGWQCVARVPLGIAPRSAAVGSRSSTAHCPKALRLGVAGTP